MICNVSWTSGYLGIICLLITLLTEKLLCECDPALFSFINQGALTVDGIDDIEEMRITDVRVAVCKLKLQINLLTNDSSLHSSISLGFVGSFWYSRVYSRREEQHVQVHWCHSPHGRDEVQTEASWRAGRSWWHCWSVRLWTHSRKSLPKICSCF